jgi:hypothetical protein
MASKAARIWYWIITVLFSLFMLFSAYGGFFPNQQTYDLLAGLMLPLYMLQILGIAKVLGVIAILQNKFTTIKEWAYAGFAFDIIGAGLCFAFVGAGFDAVLFTWVFLIPLFLSYWLWKKVKN